MEDGGERSAEHPHDVLGHRARHDVAIHRAMLGREGEQVGDPGAWVGVALSGRVGEGLGEGLRKGDVDGVVAVAEVPVEDLAADLGAGDEITDGDFVDRAFVGHRERGLAQTGAHPFGAGIGAAAAVGHEMKPRNFVDNCPRSTP